MRRLGTTAGCAALAAASLIALRQPAYDPAAWLIWGREIAAGTLDTVGGPSWKPLPVAFTTVFSLAGDAIAPSLWLLVARIGGLAAIVLAFRLARRLGGTAAGILAAAGLALATDFLYNALRGDSEGLLVALSLGAIDLHLGGRRRAAFAVALLAGLLRPEVWPLLGLYGLWLLRADRRLATGGLVVGGGVALLAAWFVPDYLATGDFLRGAGRARHPVPGSPGQSGFPFGLTFAKASIMLCWPLYAGALHAVWRAWHAAPRSARDRLVLRVAAAATALMLIVAVLAQAGFTGNIRYVTLPGSLVCILGGLGLPSLAAELRARWRPAAWRVVVGAAAVGVAASSAIVCWGAIRLVRDERALGSQLSQAIATAGGPAAVRACGRVSTTRFERQTLAYRLDLPSREVYTHGTARGTYFVRAGREAVGVRLPIRARLPGWTLRSSCELG